MSSSMRQRKQELARSTIIEALRLCDEGSFDEAFVECTVAMFFMNRLVNRSRAGEIGRERMKLAMEREQEKKTRRKPGRKRLANG